MPLRETRQLCKGNGNRLICKLFCPSFHELVMGYHIVAVPQLFVFMAKFVVQDADNIHRVQCPVVPADRQLQMIYPGSRRLRRPMSTFLFARQAKTALNPASETSETNLLSYCIIKWILFGSPAHLRTSAVLSRKGPPVKLPVP